MSFKALILIACAIVAAMAAPQGIVTQQVRLPNLDSAHIAVQRLGGSFTYTVADSGPVHGLVHYAAVPSVRYVPLGPSGQFAFAQPQTAAGQPAHGTHGLQLAAAQPTQQHHQQQQLHHQQQQQQHGVVFG